MRARCWCSLFFIIAFYPVLAQHWVISPLSNGRNINSISILKPNTIVVAGGNERNDSIEAIFSSNNYGLSWNFDIIGNIPSGLSSWITSIAFKDSLNGFGVGFNGKMIYTSNGGAVWNFDTTSVIRNYNKVVYASASTLLVAGGWQEGDSTHVDSMQTILKSTDGGNTWNVVYDSLGPWLTSIYFTDSLHGVAVGQGGTILLTGDGGTSWARITAPLARDFGGVTFVNRDTGFIVGGLISTDSTRTILQTSNGGLNWTVLRDEPGGYLTDISFTNPNTGYAVGAYASLFISTNGGLTWAPVPVTGTAGYEYFTSIKYNGPNLGVIGSLNGKVFFYLNIPLPQAYTVSAAPTDTSATLLGSLNTFGYQGQYLFTYSTDSTFTGSYSQTIPVAIICDSLFIENAQLQNLQPGKTYYYFFTASTPAGSVSGDTLSFYTGAPFFSFETQSATAVTGTSATVTGLVNQFTSPVNLFFDYGITPAFGNEVAASPASINDDGLHYPSASLTGLQSNETYYYRLMGVTSSNEVFYGSTLAFYTGTPFSVFETLAAVNVTGSSAQLNGLVEGFAVPANLTFQYGTSLAFGNEVAANPSVINDTGQQSEVLAIGSLQAQKVCYFRMKAQTAIGTFYSNTLQFYTGNLFSVFETLGANNITTTSARFNGLVEGLVAPTTLQFEYGTSALLGNTVIASPAQVSDTSIHQVTATVNNLIANTVYYYRLTGLADSFPIQGNIQQVYVGDCEVPNCDFEVWDTTIEEDPVGWNILGYVTRVPSYNGTSAVQITGANLNDAGAVLLGYPTYSGVAGGIPFTSRPDSISFHAKYNIATGDTAFILLYFKQHGIVFDQIYIPIAGNTNGNWVSLKSPINYSSSDVPDSLLLGAISSNVFPSGASGNPNSVLAIDDLIFSGNAQSLPNYNFELWDTVYFQQLQSWSTNGNSTANNFPPQGIQKTTDRVSGNYAVRIATDSVINPTFSLSAGVANNEYQPAFPLTIRHNTLNMFIMFLCQARDSLSISLSLFKQGNYLGGVQAFINASILSYTPMEFPIDYNQQNMSPDSANVSFGLGTSTSVPGSVAYIDNISFDGFRITGVQNPEIISSLRGIYCSVYPNPAKSELNVQVLQPGNYNLQIYDMQGKLVCNHDFGDLLTHLDVSSLAAGSYLVKIDMGRARITRKLIIAH